MYMYVPSSLEQCININKHMLTHIIQSSYGIVSHVLGNFLKWRCLLPVTHVSFV